MTRRQQEDQDLDQEIPRLRKVFGPSATRVEPFPDPDPDPPAAAESFAARFPIPERIFFLIAYPGTDLEKTYDPKVVRPRIEDGREWLDSSLSNAARSLSVPRLRKVFGPSATRVEPFPDPVALRDTTTTVATAAAVAGEPSEEEQTVVAAMVKKVNHTSVHKKRSLCSSADPARGWERGT
jgi:hypothetical protein